MRCDDDRENGAREGGEMKEMRRVRGGVCQKGGR